MFHWNRSVPIKTFSLNWRLSMSIFFFNNYFVWIICSKWGSFVFIQAIMLSKSLLNVEKTQRQSESG